MIARRHMGEYGTTSDQLGAIAVACRKHGAANPHAQLRKPLTLEQYRESRLIVAPLRRDDCCLVSDGAAAVVLMSAKRAQSLVLPSQFLCWVLVKDKLRGKSRSAMTSPPQRRKNLLTLPSRWRG
jgi:acetyl-CoA acetyltransferase